MPELDAEHREALHQRLIESAGCYEGESCCLDSLDSITPLVAGWLADADALREAAIAWSRRPVAEPVSSGYVRQWLDLRADRDGDDD